MTDINISCPHKHGDIVPDLMGWVCGQCFKILGDRPKRYAMVGFRIPKVWDGDRHFGPRQEVVWQAEILKSAEGTTLSTFLSAVARRYERRGGLDREAAYQAALDSVKMLEVPFGHLDYGWDRMSAVDIADEEMTYWDVEVGINS